MSTLRSSEKLASASHSVPRAARATHTRDTRLFYEHRHLVMQPALESRATREAIRTVELCLQWALCFSCVGVQLQINVISFDCSRLAEKEVMAVRNCLIRIPIHNLFRFAVSTLIESAHFNYLYTTEHI